MGDSRYIEFISAYCDGWCARCAFTHRCSAFALMSAQAMCGKAGDAFELALAGRDDGGGREVDWTAEIDGSSAAEVQAIEREHDARRARIDATPMMRLAHAYTMLVFRWCRHAPLESCDPIVVEALEVVRRDQFFITVKLHRALHGRDLQGSVAPLSIGAVQTDFNGSAKVALISIERSEAAWRVIAGAFGGEAPGQFADQLRHLQAEVDAAFPNARAFRRPGFDEPT